MEELLSNPVLSSIVIFLCQILYIHFRSVNLHHTIENKYWQAAGSMGALGAISLITIGLGASALITGNIPCIISYIVGGICGNLTAIYFKKKK